MVKVTDHARSVLDSIRTTALEQMEELPAGTPEPGLRLLIEDEQAALALDLPTDQDEVIEEDGHPVLLMDPIVSSTLDGMTIDVTHSADGDRMVIERRD